MKIKFVYKVFPALVIYTNRVKAGFAGVTIGPLVLIRPHRRDDAYRLNAEIEAYREQLKYSTNYEADVTRFAGYICTKYRLEVYAREAELLLKE